jgi:HK97 family phage portal protein
MGLFDFLRRKPPPVEAKVSQTGSAISMFGVGVPVWSTRDYASFADEGYRQNAVVFRCVKMLAGGAASVPWLLYNKAGDEIEEHPLLDLIGSPNPMASGQALFEAVYAYLLLSGNSYLEHVGPETKPPREIWTMRPDRTKVIPGPWGIPEGYQYEANGKLVNWKVDQLTGAGPILHLKEFNPLDDWYGMSRMEAAAFAVDRHNSASVHNKALLDNGARPSGALIFEPVKTGPETFAYPPEGVIAEAKTRLESGNTGPVNAGRPLVLGGSIKWEEMGITPKDMDFGAGKEDAARDICAAFGVPHILLVPGSSTYNNVREAKLELWEDSILPLMDKVLDGLNSWLCPRFGDGLRLAYDLDEISALEPRRESKRKSAVELFEKGITDHEEARESLQYDPKPEMVRDPDASTITALFNSVQVVGIGPLSRYLRSVGLVDEATTDEELVRLASEFAEETAIEEEEAAAEEEAEIGTEGQ